MPERSLAAASRLSLVCVALLVFSSAAQAADVQAVFHVATNGSDTNPGDESKPFASIEKARQAVRAVNMKMSGDIVVLLHDGTYPLEQTLVFEAADSGTNGYGVVYRAAPNANPILSGGQPVTGWQPDACKRWKAPVSVDDFRQLYINGRRAIRARGPAPNDLKLLGNDGYETGALDMAGWRNPSDIELCYDVVWCHTRCKLLSVKREGSRAILVMLQPHFSQAKTKEGVDVNDCDPARITIENALELLDEPGEWYLDRPGRTVYYIPRPGEDMTKAAVMAPAVERLVELGGTLDKPVHDIRFEGITFAHGGWLLPNVIGFTDTQANFRIDWKCPMERAGALTMTHNQHVKSPANVVCRAAGSIRFGRCTFAHFGGAGLDLEFGAQDNVVSGCRFFDISGTAIQVGDVLEDDHHPKDPRMIVENNAIVNNFIHDVGVEYEGGVGVFVGYTEATAVAHNEIARLPYSGISIGWGWGEEDAGGGNPDYHQPFKYDTPTPAQRNRIEFNHIHNVMTRKHDGGGIYAFGIMPGTVIRGNYLHDNVGEPGGIYLDEGSGGIEVVGNLVQRVPTPMNFNNRVQNRIATCNVHDNSFGARSNVAPNAGPEEALTKDAIKKIIDQSGLEPDYRDLLER